MLHSSLEEANKEVAIEVRWKAFELRPQEMRAEVDDSWFAEKKKQIEAYWPQVQTTAKETYGLDIERGPWGIDTRLAHVGAKAARKLAWKRDEDGTAGVEALYHRRVFEAYWLRQEDISHPGVLTAIAVGLGLDETAFTADLTDETLRDEVLAEERMAQQLGIRGVPATIIDERYLLSGAQPAARLIALLSEYAQTGTMNGR